MKQLVKDILVSVLMGLVAPGIILNFAAAIWQKEAQQDPPEQAAAAVSLPVRIRSADGSLTEGDMDTYLVGVVLAEMPAYFEEEALKAQGVVARTYARKAGQTGGKHGDGTICTRSECCQGYVAPDEYIQQGGTWEQVDRIRKAVASTSGQVLIYDGELIEATYFSCSGGSTEDAAAVWGREFPYLQAVESPGEEKAAFYEDTTHWTKQELEEKLGVVLGDPVVEALTTTEGGGVDTIRLGGKVFAGTEIRALLGLPSAAFSMDTEENGICITTKGYGHRVGMSQYGADAMAVSGSTFEEILAHYYPGTRLTQLEPQ